jgi:hypothetical protein
MGLALEIGIACSRLAVYPDQASRTRGMQVSATRLCQLGDPIASHACLECIATPVRDKTWRPHDPAPSLNEN